MGVTPAFARPLGKLQPLAPALRAGVARHQYAQGAGHPFRGGLNAPQARAIAAQPPGFRLPFAQVVRIVKDMLAAHPPAVFFLALSRLRRGMKIHIADLPAQSGDVFPHLRPLTRGFRRPARLADI